MGSLTQHDLLPPESSILGPPLGRASQSTPGPPEEELKSNKAKSLIPEFSLRCCCSTEKSQNSTASPLSICKPLPSSEGPPPQGSLDQPQRGLTGRQLSLRALPMDILVAGRDLRSVLRIVFLPNTTCARQALIVLSTEYEM